MVRSLWTAASGMTGQQYNIDTISNNLANINTTGFKANRADFEDLIYQSRRLAGTPSSEQTIRPTPVQVGHGVRVASTQKSFTQGSLQSTGNVFDMAIEGEGFFRVLLPNGNYAYTRNGAFQIDSDGQLVTAGGNRLLPEIRFPDNFLPESVNISTKGVLTARLGNAKESTQLGQIRLFRFVNPTGLKAVGDNNFLQTAASGEAVGGLPGTPAMGNIRHKFLENSNVSAVREMVNMIVAQRAYEMNSKAIQTSDSMLGIANNLKR